MQLAILGRQPKISLAEPESLYGAENIEPVSELAALIKTDQPLHQSRLGGTMKSAKVLNRLKSTDLEGAFKYLQTSIPDHLGTLPEGKLQFGVSSYGFKAQRDWLLRQMLSLKKIIKKNGRSVRIIENKSEALESAQVLYNKLTGPLGWELLLVKDGDDVILAQTTAVQDIDAYSKRDFDRPMRDSYVGMLPPKLAQIMINLAVGSKTGDRRLEIPSPQSSVPNLILDPFCGTGVVLQEALLMGYGAYGSDLSEKMVEYSTENLKWLENDGRLRIGDWRVEQGDAMKFDWSPVINLQSSVAVVGETYLGKPLTSLPKTDILQQIMDETNQIAKAFLRNIATQIPSSTHLCLALPAWYLGNGGFQHLDVLDHLGSMGYNRLDLVHAGFDDLIYHRENQIVARELTILEKK